MKETAGIDSKQSQSSNPNYVIKVEYTEENHTNKLFQKLKDEYGCVMGFHGSPLENFHSIVRNGLDHTYGKESSLFGDGIRYNFSFFSLVYTLVTSLYFSD
jgi:gamma-glutamylcysteine synthetase